MGKAVPSNHEAAQAALRALAASARRGERCLWITELAVATNLSLPEALRALEQLYKAGLAEPYFSDAEARRAASCITAAGLREVGGQAPDTRPQEMLSR